MTTILGPPLGQLVSFGSLIFSGAGALSAAPDNTPPKITSAADYAFIVPNGRTFGAARTGLTGAAWKGPIIEWIYWLAAPDGSSDAVAYQYLQDKLDILYDAYWNTYTYGGHSGVSGQAGDLVAKDAHGVARTALAYWISFPETLQPADVAVYQFPLQFQLAEHFHL